MKLKKWWWKYFSPKEMDVDMMVLELSASSPENKELTEKLKKEFKEKYLK